MVARHDYIQHLEGLLSSATCHDSCPNGLQVEGKPVIQRVVTGVTACLALLEVAVTQKADAILVHHGYFWKQDTRVISGMLRRRLHLLLTHDINLIAYHLPLDIHPLYGNNAQLAEKLSIKGAEPLSVPGYPDGVLWQGILKPEVSPSDLGASMTACLDRSPFHIPGTQARIAKIAWCSGAGQDFINHAADAGCDAYITGEVSERTVHIARERGIHFFAAGHHATERFGIQALGHHLACQLKVAHHFVDINNPV